MPKISLRGQEAEGGFVLIAEDEAGNMAGVFIDRTVWDAAVNKQAAWHDVLNQLEKDVVAQQVEPPQEQEEEPGFH
ncbi:hypothetical protein Ql52_gp016 [Caulobacter phage Quill_5.2]|uniref:Uncharacterized protein n=1 Tax=Caulobacter phage Quill_5.2 TaxID=3075108 RepID=A0AA96Q2E8_9CAUD|nr:hypothetical protein Ql52_gp016 [Caulobacter phage Quill_5.2]